MPMTPTIAPMAIPAITPLSRPAEAVLVETGAEMAVTEATLMVMPGTLEKKVVAAAAVAMSSARRRQRSSPPSLWPP